MEDILVPLGMFLLIGCVAGLSIYYRYRARSEMQLTVRSAIDSGRDLSPALLAELTQAVYPRRSDLRKGVVFVALGLAVLVLAFFIDEQDAVKPLIGVSAFPFMIGIAYLILWRLGLRDQYTSRV